MAFHDMWGDDEGSEGPSLRSVLKWLGLLLVGLIVGVATFVMLLPGGPLNPAVQAIAQSEARASVQSNAPIPNPGPTACPTEKAPPTSTVAGFVQALNRGDDSDAWSFLDPTLQQQLYGGQMEVFASDWSKHGTIQLGQITYSQPSSEQASLVAPFRLEHPPGAQFQYLIRLRYDEARCQWLIQEFSIPSEPTPTESTTTTPTAAAD